MLTKLILIMKSKWFLGIGCLLIGAATILGIRFVTYKVPYVHYHANFALYFNGQQEEFKSKQYYTEVSACTLNNTVKQPSERVHMHDNINNVVHVEDNSVTWSQFFTNLGWTLGPTFIASPDGTIYLEKGRHKLHLLLNGQDYTDFGGIQNNVIKDKDRLLISFGDESKTTLNQQYSAIPSTAQKYDSIKDPASCSGNHGTTLHDRLVHLF